MYIARSPYNGSTVEDNRSHVYAQSISGVGDGGNGQYTHIILVGRDISKHIDRLQKVAVGVIAKLSHHSNRIIDPQNSIDGFIDSRLNLSDRQFRFGEISSASYRSFGTADVPSVALG
ncbi:hypothetical protein [Nitrospira sp. M1]